MEVKRACLAARIELSGAAQEEVNGVWFPYPEFVPTDELQEKFDYSAEAGRWPARWCKEEAGEGREFGEPTDLSFLRLDVHDDFVCWWLMLKGQGRYRGVVEYEAHESTKHLVDASDEQRKAFPHLPHMVNVCGNGHAQGNSSGWISQADLFEDVVPCDFPDVGPSVKYLDEAGNTLPTTP